MGVLGVGSSFRELRNDVECIMELTESKGHSFKVLNLIDQTEKTDRKVYRKYDMFAFINRIC